MMMKYSILFLFATVLSLTSASVFLPHDVHKRSPRASLSSETLALRSALRRASFAASGKIQGSSRQAAAMAIPGYGVTEQIFVGGFGNFLTAYNAVITARILLSWFPQSQSIGVLQPVFAITDPFLNIFRGIIPSIGGLDISPIAAFFLLNVLTNATAALGCDVTAMDAMKKKLSQQKVLFGAALLRKQEKSGVVEM